MLKSGADIRAKLGEIDFPDISFIEEPLMGDESHKWENNQIRIARPMSQTVFNGFLQI
jgi:hypothetical protein